MSTRDTLTLFRCALTLLAALLVAFASSPAWAGAEERQAALDAQLANEVDDDADAWDLFADRLEIEQRMTAEVRSRLAEQGHVVPAEERVEAAA